MDATPEEDGELRKEPNEVALFCRFTQRVGSDFLCQTCGCISTNDPNRLEDPMRVTLQHVGSERSESNLTEEDRRIFYSRDVLEHSETL